MVVPGLAAAREDTTTTAVTGLVRDGLTPAQGVHQAPAMLDLELSQAAVSRRTTSNPPRS